MALEGRFKLQYISIKKEKMERDVQSDQQKNSSKVKIFLESVVSSTTEDEGESEYEINEHDEYDEDQEGDDEEEFEDGPSEETKTNEDVQIGKSNKEKKTESEEDIGMKLDEEFKQLEVYFERVRNLLEKAKTLFPEMLVMSKSIIGDDVGDDVTTKAPIFDETPHTSKSDEDKSSQSDFTASMMIEYEREEDKILMVSKPTFGETPQNNNPSMEDNSQSNFTASMIVEYEQKENYILKDRQQREEDRKKEAEKVKES
ncbi:hypothetical protein L1987_52349 [Smallanthus sonchifolius]|uniref:Uncharacterized protein n=1 Tax=Smallanthus sonchifolius TaxID=185202 RepID=A0ACB9ET85_9ASTR|nr:hypothetical protein L1987_52349 [Smallanthus sonchifolius]